MHLLVETAIVDSTDYEILSYEEVDELKKEYNFLSNRIDASKRKLALESKVRDAALSLSRLYSKNRKPRRSLLGGVSDVGGRTDEELTASNRKCEELSQELWRLNNRAMEVQRRLLQHSAGILGMTHQSAIIRGYPKSPQAPGSPSSQYTLVNRSVTNSSLTVEFDDRSFYRTPDKLDEFGNYDRRASTDRGARYPYMDVGVPPRSNKERRGSSPASDDPHLARRLEDLNMQLRNVIVQLTANQSLPPPLPIIGSMNGSAVQEQLSVLEQSIKYIQRHPPLSSPSPNPAPAFNLAAQELERTDAILLTLWDMLILGEEEVRNQKRALIQNDPNHNSEYPDSDPEDYNDNSKNRNFSISAFSAKVQALYTRATSIRDERTLLRLQSSQQQTRFNAEVAALKEKHSTREDNLSLELSTLSSQLDQLENVLEQRERDTQAADTKANNLLDELRATQLEVGRRRSEARIAREELTAVMIQLDKQRRIDAQRQMEDNSGRGKDAAELDEERKTRFEQQEALFAQLKDKEELLMVLQGELEDAREDRDITRVELDALMSESEGRLKNLEAEIAALKEAKRITEEASNVSQMQLLQKERQMGQMDNDMRELEGKVAELSTEVAMLKAELDEAYGSRKQRAAETAQARAAAAALEAANKGPQTVDPGLLEEVEALATKNYELMEELALLKAEKNTGGADLERRCKVLQTELDGILADYENLTKQIIENEKDRIKLEGVIDGLRDKCEGLETTLADQRVQWLGMRTPGPDGKLVGGGRYGDGESTSTHVLKTEFKKMMRDMRSESTRALRVRLPPPLLHAWLMARASPTNTGKQAEQEQRRNLEQQIRSMKQEALSRRGTVSSAKANAS